MNCASERFSMLDDGLLCDVRKPSQAGGGTKQNGGTVQRQRSLFCQEEKQLTEYSNSWPKDQQLFISMNSFELNSGVFMKILNCQGLSL